VRIIIAKSLFEYSILTAHRNVADYL